ncbi:hypothetical protein BCV69DRAFT_214604 [Microstroma glucosiphilum]|uniref:Uncharacterized protein n=1 Tax=Pseudomicrostroma glucosiphilum TaxID=1684307 RepID=A0A316U474_9BASI|nr:hypothetical protein BCV69DRAFT_214604 [Pseudomicrostroma glucosiphilum]PWN19980.1 hypothetical protein BCV69DRAFT_214604 [Pseudomicrostroma glucosiphilum]
MDYSLWSQDGNNGTTVEHWTTQVGGDTEQSSKNVSPDHSGSDGDLQIGHGTTVWRNTAIFPPTPDKHSRAPSVDNASAPVYSQPSPPHLRDPYRQEASLPSTPTTHSHGSSELGTNRGNTPAGSFGAPRGSGESLRARRQGTSSSAGDRKMVGAGIFIVSKSGPSWVSDRPSPSLPTFAAAAEANAQQANYTMLSPTSITHEGEHAFMERTDKLYHASRRDCEQTLLATASNSIVNWLEAQETQKAGLLFSPGGQTQFITQQSSSDSRKQIAQHRPSTEEHALSAPPRRVSGPRPQSSTGRRSQETRCTLEVTCPPRQNDVKDSSEDELVDELDRALIAHLKVTTSADYARHGFDDDHENDVFPRSATTEGTEGKGDGDDCSMVARMGSMSSASFTQRSFGSDTASEAMAGGRAGSTTLERVAADGQEATSAHDIDSDEEQRFWVGSDRGSAAATPLPSIEGNSDTQPTSVWEASSVTSHRDSSIFPIERREKAVPSRSLVLPQVADVASRRGSGSSWRRSHPIFSIAISSKPPLIEKGRSASSASTILNRPVPSSRRSSRSAGRFEEVKTPPRSNGRGHRETMMSLADSEYSEGWYEENLIDSKTQSGLLSTPHVTVQTAKKGTVSSPDVMMRFLGTPSPARPEFLVPRSPAKKYAEACVQAIPDEAIQSTDQRQSSSSHVVNKEASRKSRRPDLRIDTVAAADPGSSLSVPDARSEPKSALRSALGVCCPKCGHDFLPPPKKLDAASAIEGAKKLAEARVQKRRAALAATSSRSLRSAPAHTSDFPNESPPPMPSTVTVTPDSRRQIESDDERMPYQQRLRESRSTFASSIESEGSSSRNHIIVQRTHLLRTLASSNTVASASATPHKSERSAPLPPKNVNFSQAAEKKRERTDTHSKRPSLQDVLSTFKELTSPLDKLGTQLTNPRGQSPAAGTPLLGRKGSLASRVGMPGWGSSASPSRQASGPAAPRGGSPAQVIRPQTASDTWVAPDSWAAPGSSAHPAVPSKSGQSRDRVYSPDLRDTSSGNDSSDEDDADVVAPFAAPSAKALKLLGLDAGPQTTQNDLHSGRHRPGPSPGGSRVGHLSSEGYSGDRTPTGRDPSWSPDSAAHRKRNPVRTTTASSSSSSSSMLRASKSYIDLPQYPSSTVLPGRKEHQQAANLALFSAGPVEGSTQGSAMKKLRQAWRKGKGKDSSSTDYRESLEPTPMVISSPIGLSRAKTITRVNTMPQPQPRGSMHSSDDVLMSRYRNDGEEEEEEKNTTPTGSYPFSGTAAHDAAEYQEQSEDIAEAAPDTRWALPSLDLSDPPRFGEDGLPLQSEGRVSLEDDADSISWFTAAYA